MQRLYEDNFLFQLSERKSEQLGSFPRTTNLIRSHSRLQDQICSIFKTQLRYILYMLSSLFTTNTEYSSRKDILDGTFILLVGAKLIHNIFIDTGTSETTLTLKIILLFYKVRAIDAYYINTKR